MHEICRTFIGITGPVFIVARMSEVVISEAHPFIILFLWQPRGNQIKTNVRGRSSTASRTGANPHNVHTGSLGDQCRVASRVKRSEPHVASLRSLEVRIDARERFALAARGASIKIAASRCRRRGRATLAFRSATCTLMCEGRECLTAQRVESHCHFSFSSAAANRRRPIDNQ